MPYSAMPEISWKFEGKPYDLNSIIGPDQVWLNLDIPAEEVRTALNALITALNATTASSSTGFTPNAAVDAGANTVQLAYDALVTLLRGTGGATWLKAAGISGLTGDNVQALLGSLKTFIDTKDTAQSLALTNHKNPATNDHDGRYYTETEIDALDGANVKKTGNQTIEGIKTFSSSPIVPIPTTDYQATPKKHIDDNFPTKSEITSTRKLSATGDFSGTLNGMPIVAAEPGLSSEVAGAHISAVKTKTFATIDARFEESEQDLVTYKAETAANVKQIINATMVNLIENGDFSEGISGWSISKSTNTVVDNTLINTCTSTADSSTYQDLKGVLIGDKIFVKIKIRATNSSCTQLLLDVKSTYSRVYNPVINQWYDLYVLVPKTIEGTDRVQITQFYADATIASGKAMEIQYAIGINETQDLGAGNEPTVAQMYSILDSYPNRWFNGKASSIITVEEKTEYALVDKANSPTPIFIKTYDGGNQPVHPKVLYFDVAWSAYKYWMAYTPYPDDNDYYENPCIACSIDGVIWTTPTGLINPLASLTTEEDAVGGHYSDTHLVYNSTTNKLECWYRYNVNNVYEEILRRTSSNGVTWSAEEIMWSFTGVSQFLSPVVIFEDAKYKMWYVSYSKILYMESTDGVAWCVPVETVFLLPVPYLVWHIDIVKTDLGYELLANVYKSGEIASNKRILMNSVSPDGLIWGEFNVCITPSSNKKSFDSKQIYRSTMVKIAGIYYVYYSAYSVGATWGIGLSIGESLDKLVGVYLTRETSKGDMLVKNNLLIDDGRYIRIGGAASSYSGVLKANPTVTNGLSVRSNDDALPGALSVGRLVFEGAGGVKANLLVTDVANVINVFVGETNTTAFMKMAGIQFVGGASAPATNYAGMAYWFTGTKKLGLSPDAAGTFYMFQTIRKCTTAARPTANLETGERWFDTTLNKPIWRNTANDGWIDAMGTTV